MRRSSPLLRCKRAREVGCHQSKSIRGMRLPRERAGHPMPSSPSRRVLAATHEDLEREISLGRRSDLFLRLRVFELPPLRARPRPCALHAAAFALPPAPARASQARDPSRLRPVRDGLRLSGPPPNVWGDRELTLRSPGVGCALGEFAAKLTVRHRRWCRRRHPTGSRSSCPWPLRR